MRRVRLILEGFDDVTELKSAWAGAKSLHEPNTIGFTVPFTRSSQEGSLNWGQTGTIDRFDYER